MPLAQIRLKNNGVQRVLHPPAAAMRGAAGFRVPRVLLLRHALRRPIPLSFDLPGAWGPVAGTAAGGLGGEAQRELVG